MLRVASPSHLPEVGACLISPPPSHPHNPTYRCFSPRCSEEHVMRFSGRPSMIGLAGSPGLASRLAIVSNPEPTKHNPARRSGIQLAGGVTSELTVSDKSESRCHATDGQGQILGALAAFLDIWTAQQHNPEGGRGARASPTSRRPPVTSAQGPDPPPRPRRSGWRKANGCQAGWGGWAAGVGDWHAEKQGPGTAGSRPDSTGMAM